jgi:uncharacterized short protein YbdD (DUF466 family)
MRRVQTAMRRLAATTRKLVRPLAAQWRGLRALAGEDAYQRYLRHVAAQHAGEPPLTRRDFWRDAERRKWDGVSRCC